VKYVRAILIPRCRLENNIAIDVREIEFEVVGGVELAEVMSKRCDFVKTSVNLRIL
jgi:hypothetical protein